MSTNAVDLLRKIRGYKEQPGVKLAVVTTENPIQIAVAGSNVGLDVDLFEIPAMAYPLKEGDRLLILPLVSSDGDRFAVLQNMDNGAVIMATMKGSSSLKIDRMKATYSGDKLIIPSNWTMEAGTRVSVAPVIDNKKLKYAVIQRY